MKTTLLTLFSLIAFSVFAQNPYGAPPPPPPSDEMNMPDEWGGRYFHFGLNITPGVYWTSPTTSNNTSNGATLGFGYGANLEFYFTRNYAFLLGFELTNINAKYINTNANPSLYTLDSTITHNETVQYLQIPLELKLKTVPFGNVRYYGVIGLDFGFRLKATDDYTTSVTPDFAPGPVSGTYYFSGNNADISSQTDFFRVSLVIGGGVEYTIAESTALQASLTYNNCFTNLNNTSTNAINVKGMELMVGILF
jgi:hypothetical protein